jgi:hypothetical protein
MSSSDADKLPDEFLLHIRNSRKGAWSHYVLVRRTLGPDGKNKLVLSPFSTILVPAKEPAPYKAYAPHYDIDNLPFAIPFVSYDTVKIILAHFVKCNTTTVQIHGDPPRTVPILFTNVYRDLLGLRLKPNFIAIAPAPEIASPVVPPPAPLMIPSPTVGLATAPPPLSSVPSMIAGILGQNTIEHVQGPAPVTAKVKKVKVPKPTIASPVAATGPRRGDLSPFVAKQLLALAQLRHDQCPIIAEEYSDGNTAVMPCGHLFAQIAIEETFKKTPNTCPACRATGRPTYV